MNTLVETKEQAVSVTDLHRRAKSLLDELVSGQQSRYVIFRKNMPSAVVLAVDEFERMTEELADLRVEREAIRRLHSGPREEASEEEIQAVLRE